MQGAKARGVSLFPLIVGYCGYDYSALEPYQAFNSPKAPLESLSTAEQNRVLNEASIEISKSMQSHGSKDTVPVELTQCKAMLEIKKNLSDTSTAFMAQRRRRDGLVATIENRLNIKNELSYEKFFFTFYPQLNDGEKFEFDQIRAITEGPLFLCNRKILECFDNHPELLEISPKFVDVRRHLVFWVNKFERVFSKNRAMCLLYTGVEDGVSFPAGVDGLVDSWISNNCRKM